MNTLKKIIWFDQNSEPQKNYIWYRGEGKFYEYSGGNWVLTYDLSNTPTQSELESIADKLSDGSEETVDANIGSILNALSDKIGGILDLIPEPASPGITLDDVTVSCQYNFDPMEMPYENQTKAQICERLNLSEALLDGIMNGNYIRMFNNGTYSSFIFCGDTGFRTSQIDVYYDGMEDKWTLSYPDSGE